MQPLPIDSLLPEIVESLRRAPQLVIEAPPGAGKTTRVPAAVLAAGLAGAREVWVLEPRRLAARLAARRVAEELGERLGETVGYQVRFEDVSSPRTRVRFLTEGLLTRRLLSDPELHDAGVVVLDEFHERHLQTDLALALLKRLQQSARPDLRIVAMSATLDAAPVARFLRNCPVVRSIGRQYEVEIEHLARPDERPLAAQVEAGLRRLLAEGLDGHALIFLPGIAEIRRAQETCANLAAQFELSLLPLHGELPAAEQERAVGASERRKVILSTNVAETSVTIEGVAAVIDSGLARVAGYSQWSGLPTLNVARVSRASAIQRAGRAGRTRAGRCLRLYTAQDFAARPEYETPEVSRLDLAGPALELHAAGVAELRSFDWFETPPVAALDAADALLQRLGAIDNDGKLKNLGKRMLRLPLHPRLARVLTEAGRRGVARAGCTVAALISERDIRARDLLSEPREIRNQQTSRGSRSGSSDVLEMLDLFHEAERRNFEPETLRRMNLHLGAVRVVERVSTQLYRLLEKDNSQPTAATNKAEPAKAAESELLISILAGFPDRVARRRIGEGGRDVTGGELLLANGGGAQLAPESVVRQAEFLVAIEAEERREVAVSSGGRSGVRLSRRGGRIVVRIASAIEADWLLDLFADAIRETVEVTWNAQAERVETVSRLLYDRLVLDERAVGSIGAGEAAQVLSEAAQAAGIQAFAEPETIAHFLARVEFVALYFPDAGISPLDEKNVNESLTFLCTGRRSFAELRAAVRAGELLAALRRQLTPEQNRMLTTMAPERVALAGGRQVRVHYERAGAPPWIASRLQDFFGMKEGPIIAGGRVPLVLHLLAPNQRPVQVTADLQGFWSRHYPQVRRELKRRYPRHAWPEDPLSPREKL